MKKIDNSFITSAAWMPFKQGTWTHLQQAYQEGMSQLAQMVISLAYQTYDPTKVYVIYGMTVTIVGGNFNITAGAVYYNGEIYLFAAQTLPYPATHTYVFNLSTAYYTDATADPVLFTDGNTHNVHVIRTAVLADSASTGTLTNDANSNYSSLIYPVAKTQLAYKITQQTSSAFPLSINFLKDVILAVTAAPPGLNTINLDFTFAVPGTKVQIITYVNSGASFGLSYSGSPVISLVSGSLSSPTTGTNIIELIYRGKPFGGDFLSVSVTLQP